MVKEKKLIHFLKKKGECEGHEIEAVCEVVPILAYFFRWCCLIWRSKKITCHFSASPPQRFRPRSATGYTYDDFRPDTRTIRCGRACAAALRESGDRRLGFVCWAGLGLGSDQRFSSIFFPNKALSPLLCLIPSRCFA
jgi:hypothetical protein